MSNKVTVYLAAMGTVVLWGMSYIWSDRLLDLHIPVEFFVPIRILLAGILLWGLNKIMGYDMRIRRRDWGKFFLLALCEPFIYFVAETYGIKLTESPTITALVIATNPIFAALVGIFLFREKIDWMNILGIFVTLGGLLLVTWARTSTGPYFILGIIILFIAVISEVSHISLTKVLSDGYAPSVIVMYQFLFGAVMFLPLFFTLGVKDFDASLYLSWDVLYPTLALAVLCSATAFSLWAFAIKHLGVARSSIFLAVVPLATALLSVLFGDERLCLPQWLGLAVAMVGLLLTQKASGSAPAQESKWTTA